MGDLSNKAEQEKVLNEIFSRYDESTKHLYLDILKFYSDKGANLSKSKVREEIMDKIRGIVK